MARVVIEGVTKVFQGPKSEQIRALDHVNLTVEDKELMVLVGPSGCGKTTLLRLIAGLEELTEGTISIDGQMINRVAAGDRDIAMVFQNYALYPHMTAYENMAFGLKLRHCPRAEIEKRVKEAAEMLDLTDCLDRKPTELSGGQRQRVGVGRAVVRRPRLFLFDEPLSNLDPQMRVQMRTGLSRLHERLASTMLYVTHDQLEAMTLGDRIAVMNRGVIQQIAAPMQLYQRPANLFVAGFIGSPPMNLLPGSLVPNGKELFFEQPAASGTTGLRLRLEPEKAAGVIAYAAKEVVLGIRPERVAHRIHAPNIPPEWTFEAVVEVVEPSGPETHIHLGGGQSSMIARVPGDGRITVGQKVPLAMDMRQALFFDPKSEKLIG